MISVDCACLQGRTPPVQVARELCHILSQSGTNLRQPVSLETQLLQDQQMDSDVGRSMLQLLQVLPPLLGPSALPPFLLHFSAVWFCLCSSFAPIHVTTAICVDCLSFLLVACVSLMHLIVLLCLPLLPSSTFVFLICQSCQTCHTCQA